MPLDCFPKRREKEIGGMRTAPDVGFEPAWVPGHEGALDQLGYRWIFCLANAECISNHRRSGAWTAPVTRQWKEERRPEGRKRRQEGQNGRHGDAGMR